MPPTTFDCVVMDGAVAVTLGAAKCGSARMFDSDSNLLGLVIEFNVCNGPG